MIQHMHTWFRDMHCSRILSRPARRSFYSLFLILMVVGAAVLAPATALAEEAVHVVSRGENLSSIARRYNVSLHTLAANNGVANPNIIRVGQRLVIPGAQTTNSYNAPAISATLPGGDGYHVVRRGNTLSQIAKNSGMSLADLMRLNGISNANFIWVGQKLRVTARVSAITPTKQPKPQLANTIYIVRTGDSLSQIAKDNNVSVQNLLIANGLPNANFIYVGQRLRIQAPPAPVSGTGVAGAPANGRRWIEINLSNQTLTAWQGNVRVLHTNVSTGTWATPTVTGRYSVGTKLSSQHMSGPGYSLPGVPWVMYFYSGYAIHGTYWHNNFGTPMSHGCVNMRTGEAQMLYNWAPVGTEVNVHY